MKKILLAALAATMLSGCAMLEDDFWDEYDSTYDSPAGDDTYGHDGEDCDC